MNYGASVIICCYNSASRLPKTLEHLAAQKFSNDLIAGGFRTETIIVNNNSSDSTVEVAESYRLLFTEVNIDLKIIDEPKAGQMCARMKGAQESTFDCIIFCDDDNWLSENYVQLAFEMLISDKTIGAGGGKNIPVTEISPPEWFEEYKNYYGTGIPASQSGDVSYKTFLLGAGMVTRKHLFLQMFDPEFPSLLPGRNGPQLSTGDDFEYCKRLLLDDYRLYYDERMVLKHFIPAERLTLEYRERLMAGIEQAGKILEEYDLAIRVHNKTKNKNRRRLLLLAPFRILFSNLGLSKRAFIDEWLTLYYLSPVSFNKKTPRYIIKELMEHNKKLHEEKKAR